MTEQIVIIGASHAGISCAEQLRMQGFSGGLTLVDRQSGAPIERPPLSKSYLGSRPEDDNQFLLRRPEWYEKLQITMIDGITVNLIEPRGASDLAGRWTLIKLRQTYSCHWCCAAPVAGGGGSRKCESVAKCG